MSKYSSSKDLPLFESQFFESKEEIREEESLKSVLLNLLQKSSIYALSQLVTSSGFGRRILWFVVLVFGLFGCSYEIYRFLSLYYQYPVVITLEVKNSFELEFPAVTVCNLNRISYKNYRCLLLDLSEKECKTAKKMRPIMTDRRKFASCSDDFNGTFTEERSRILTFLNKYLKTDENHRKSLGYDSTDLIASCTYNGEICSVKNFTEFSSLQFGNCFSFNRAYGEDIPLRTPYIGPNSGLEISISLNSHSYSPIASSVGARVVIHEPDIEPNPEDNGINISPGYETSLAIQETSIYRLPAPYRDKCKEYKGGKPSDRHQTSCITNCMQNINLHTCGCADPFMRVESYMPLCDLRNQSKVCCLDEVMKSFSENNISCSCPLPCKSTSYEMTISTAEWPSELFFNKFLKANFLRRQGIFPQKELKTAISVFTTQIKGNSTSKDSNATSSVKKDYFHNDCSCENVFKDHRQDVAKLKVFYKSLEKISYKQEPMFQDSELFSQLGGQLGLWLGVSLVALFECIETLSHLIYYFLKKTSKAKNTSSSLQNNFFETITKV